MPFDPAFDDDSQPWWQFGPPLRITVHPNPTAGKPSGNRNESDGIDDWIVPGKRRDDDSYPDDWIVPGKAAAADPYPDDWITPPRARNDASYPDDWIVPARPSSANSTQVLRNIQSTTPVINPLATPVHRSPAAPPIPLQSFWSLIPASVVGAMAWRPPVFLNADPLRSVGDGPVSTPSTSPILPRMGSSSSADTGPTPAWSPSQSLLGPLAQPSSSATPQSGNSNGLLSIPPYGPFFSYLEQVPPKSLLQNLGEPNRPVPRISGSEAEPFTRLLNALNPIGAAHAAEGEGPPLPPEMARALAQALLDAAAAKKLAETQDLLAKYHEATRDLFAVAQGEANGRALRKALELSGIERPEGYAAHHIVAGDIKAAEEARTVLQKFKIDINEASNGVFLPGTTSTEIINGEAVHSTIHTKRYVAAVNEALLNAKTREQAIDILTGIAKALRSGGYP